MIAILTDKPNVGKEIARILGAQTRENGYMTGNGYMVTWTFGNMAVTGHAERLWNRTPGTGRLSSESRSLQTNGKACQDRYGVGTRHQCGTSTESD